ncbi:hypothetical protein SHI21_06695 [Bacteriovorax sp. PP10]|uniref:DUF2388 domain-containing protein n=1 Tax=Bacteriovorax antarcticus TaxID=3088717 RepID=A0ABU5VS55_9BACT|nr:hypothetical protein [Bacteriovorax sp. PP10]MEA9355879.1 hypothetical protein [Bacteriovorax sp. PP10]
MKKLAIMCALMTTTISFQANALEAIAGTYISASLGLSTIGGMTSSGKECQIMVCKRSEQIVLDAQDYYASGKMSEFLATSVKELKETAGDISDDEAVDILVDFAHRTLELY